MFVEYLVHSPLWTIKLGNLSSQTQCFLKDRKRYNEGHDKCKYMNHIHLDRQRD